MEGVSSERSKSVSILGRNFKIRLLGFTNGCFLVVSEGVEERLGSLTLSIKIQDKVEHTVVIPERWAGVFSSILADMVANFTQGITVVSLYLLSGVDVELARELLEEVRSLLNASRKLRA